MFAKSHGNLCESIAELLGTSGEEQKAARLGLRWCVGVDAVDLKSLVVAV